MTSMKNGDDPLITEARRQAWPDWDIYIRDRCRCVYCGLDGMADMRVWGQLQIDHVVPRAVAPELERVDENRVVACTRCNVLKGSFDPRQALEGDERGPDVLISAARRHITRQRLLEHEATDFELMKTEILERNDPRCAR